ncbi:hypothetical protein [Mycobacterium sp. ENV421]|nr:hypothetical protein [Mycobacterium sp. ENV421]
MDAAEDRPKRQPLFLVNTEGMTKEQMKAAAREALQRAQAAEQDTRSE